jgi:hypothetical protein
MSLVNSYAFLFWYDQKTVPKIYRIHSLHHPVYGKQFPAGAVGFPRINNEDMQDQERHNFFIGCCMRHDVPFDHHGISGAISIRLYQGQTLDHFCTAFIKGYDAARYEAAALRVYAGKEMIITIYAVDRTRLNGEPGKKLKVKKFKLENIPVANLFNYLEAFNFTVAPGKFDLENMEVAEEQVQS